MKSDAAHTATVAWRATEAWMIIIWTGIIKELVSIMKSRQRTNTQALSREQLRSEHSLQKNALYSIVNSAFDLPVGRDIFANDTAVVPV